MQYSRQTTLKDETLVFLCYNVAKISGSEGGCDVKDGGTHSGWQKFETDLWEKNGSS